MVYESYRYSNFVNKISGFVTSFFIKCEGFLWHMSFSRKFWKCCVKLLGIFNKKSRSVRLKNARILKTCKNHVKYAQSKCWKFHFSCTSGLEIMGLNCKIMLILCTNVQPNTVKPTFKVNFLQYRKCKSLETLSKL